MLYGRRQTGRINAEAAVSRQVDNDFVRCSNFAAENCGRSESHRSKTGRVMNGSRNGDVKFLCNAILVPAYICKDYCILRDYFFDILENPLRRHRETAVT